MTNDGMAPQLFEVGELMGERRQSTTSVEYLHDEFDFDKKRRNWYEKIVCRLQLK